MTMLDTLAGAFFGSLIATGIVARLTQKWIERRERRHRRDELRLELYLEVIGLVVDNEEAIAKCGAEGDIPSLELQRKRLRIGHSLKLLAASEVRDAYDEYRGLVFQETVHRIEHREPNTDEVVQARDRLVDAMARDAQQA